MSRLKKTGTLLLSAMMTLSLFSTVGTKTVQAADFSGTLEKVDSVQVNGNVATISFNDGEVTGKITFLENGIFRYNVDPSREFSEYPAYRSGYPTTGKIVAQPDSSDRYSKPAAKAEENDDSFVITNGETSVVFDKDTALMTVKSGNAVVMEEKIPLSFNGNSTVQTLVQHTESSNTSDKVAEQFYGGGTQNGRLVHTGEVINIANESKWNDGNVSSPSPFYYTTNGYGVLRNTWRDGSYDFGSTQNGTVTTTHGENEYDAYIFVSDAKDGSSVAQELLDEYFTVTGNPVLLPAYGFYLGHLNAYNRDAWSNTSNGGSKWTIKGNDPYTSEGTTTYENGGTGFMIKENQQAETLNGKGPTVATDNVPAGVTYLYEFSAQAVLNEYQDYDMPMGFFLPNDGYGAGYGQNGYNMTGGVNADGTSSSERLAAVAANVNNLEEFVTYCKEHGVATGLWTQSNLTPDSNPNTYWHLLRDFEAEVAAGVSTLKTDVAWVGPGYSFQLSGVKQAYNIVTTTPQNDGSDNVRPNIISLDGWAGSQRYNSVWTGDQSSTSFEYIRFHIPTFIGQSLSGNPNIGSDMDGIWGGSPIIGTRDYQWKSFAPQMLDMDGWGSYAKGPYVHGDPYTGVSRMYLKTKAMMMPYIYTNAYAAANIDTGNDDTGLPMIRAMFLEFPDEEYAYTEAGSQYQYMWGEYLLVAPVYEEVEKDAIGNDVRNGIYLPGGEEQIWIDYFTGEQYRGGQVLNGFDAPLWKLPLFVKNGAIIPMYAEHNSALPGTEDSVDKSIRLVEFWPEGEADFTAIEDDGSYIENNVTEEEGYGDLENISYGDHVSTTYTSKVDGDTATLTATASTGTYKGYDKEKDTTFIVHASAEPSSVQAFNGNEELKKVEVTSKEDFDNASAENGTFVYFYDTNPTIETFASEEETIIADMVKDVQVSPKLYVKFAKTDTQANEQKLVIKGFENKGTLNSTELNESLQTPTLSELEDQKQPSSITLTWNQITDANTYEILVDGTIDGDGNVTSGMIHSIDGTKTTFTHTGLNYHSEHSYYIRSVNADGHSKWSEVFETISAEDPFLNTPEVTSDMVTWTGNLYNNQGGILAFDRIFQQGDSGFHSGDKAINETLTVDYGKAYILDYIEYYPREDAGNGTVTEMRVETSLDGVNWVVHGESGSSTDPNSNLSYTFARNGEMKTIDLRDPNTGDDSIGARYVRFTALKSVGDFFSARELKVYTIAEEAGTASKPFLVGNISSVGMSEPTLTTFQQMYQKGSSQHGSYKNATWVGEVQKLYGDINFNGIADVWDYAFTAFAINGGTKKTGSVSGDIVLQASASTVSVGETFTVDVTAVDVKNLNAYGSIINYDPDKIEYVNTTYTGTGSMYTQGMTGAIINDDGTAYINHNALNMGNQPLVNGSKVLATITLKAKSDITLNDVTDPSAEDFVIDLTKAMLIGPDFSYKESEITNDVTIPDVPTTQTIEYKRSDFDITMTNDVLTTDDGTNVNEIVQTGSYDSLFDGNYGRDFEFKWDMGDTILPDGQKLPTTMHLNMKTPSPMSLIQVYNANDGNGYLQSMKSVVYYTDGTSKETNFDTAQSVYEIEVDDSKVVESVDLTFLSSKGEVNSGNYPVTNRMLTLAEIDITYTSGIPAEGIQPAEGTATELYVGYMEKIEAQVLPVECPNQYFTVTSSDQEIAKIVTLTDSNNNPMYYVQGMKEGIATITLKSAADESITYEYQITVKNGVDKTELLDAINKTTGVAESIYTAESYAAYKDAYDRAVRLSNDPAATRADVETATAQLLEAYEALKTQPVDSSLKLDVNVASGQVVANAEALYSESNVPNNMFDDDLSTYWESPWAGADANLPKDIILTLDGTYSLEQISFISHTIQNGGVTEYEIAIDNGDGSWMTVATGTVDPEAYKQGENVRVDARFVPTEAKRVKITILGAVGRIPSEDNMYGRIAEMELYGTKITTKAELYAYVTEIQNMENDGYTDESWNALQDAIVAAFEVYDDENATNEDVALAFDNLKKAVDALEKETPAPEVEKPSKEDRAALYALLEKYDGYKASDYTADSWAAFKSAYETAKAAYMNENATKDEVIRATEALETAGKNLKKVSGGSDIETSPSDDNTTTEKPADTSASMPIVPFVAIMLFAACAVLVLERKKTANK